MEQKQKVLEEYEHSITWVKSLAGLTEDQWRTPIAPGKWTIAEVIGHLIPWDAFVLEQRLPYIYNDKPLPSSPNVEQMNRRASEETKGRGKEATIALFVEMRDKLVRALADMPDAYWSREFSMPGKSMTLTEYMNGLVTHDRGHFAEIAHALKETF